MAIAESYEEANVLDSEALHSLLESSRPEQRVWAIWALALRSCGEISQLAHRAIVDGNPGVRRSLAVVLAAHHETDLLVALARRDPDLAVRVTATHLVTRLAVGGAIDPAVVIDAATREPPLQMAVLAEIDAGAPLPLIRIAERLLASHNECVQRAACEALLRVKTPAARALAHAWQRVRRN